MPTYDGEYAPDDQRDVTLTTSDVPGEPERTGPRESASRDPEAASADSGTAQDLHTTRGAGADADAVMLGTTSEESPADVARADANRPLYQPSGE